MSRSQRRRGEPVRSGRRRFRRKVPASKCHSCQSPNRTHSREGAVCASCGADWPVFLVDSRGP